MRCVSKDAAKDKLIHAEGVFAAVAAFVALRSLLEAVQTDAAVLLKMQKIMYPCLLHSLSVDGLHSSENGIDNISFLIFHIYKSGSISNSMWKLFPLLFNVYDTNPKEETTYRLENVDQIVVAVKNYMARDPDGMMKAGEN